MGEGGQKAIKKHHAREKIIKKYRAAKQNSCKIFPSFDQVTELNLDRTKRQHWHSFKRSQWSIWW